MRDGSFAKPESPVAERAYRKGRDLSKSPDDPLGQLHARCCRPDASIGQVRLVTRERR
jgi:hypothetical protein